jgi:hypothetical protein
MTAATGRCDGQVLEEHPSRAIGPAKAGLYMHVPGRAEPRRLAARGIAHPHNEMGRSSLKRA